MFCALYVVTMQFPFDFIRVCLGHQETLDLRIALGAAKHFALWDGREPSRGQWEKFMV